jgi:BMFP domain-containing protein YqiC
MLRAAEEAIMATENRLFDDLAKVASGALGTLGGVRTELETRIREQVERIFDRMNLVRREEFDAVQTMAANARAAQEQLEARIAALEARIGAVQTPSPSSDDGRG